MTLFAISLPVRGRDDRLRYGRAIAVLKGRTEDTGATRLVLQAEIPLVPTELERLDQKRLRTRLMPLMQLAAELIDAELETRVSKDRQNRSGWMPPRSAARSPESITAGRDLQMTHYVLTVPVKGSDGTTRYPRVGVVFENTKRETDEKFLSLKLDFPVGATEFVAFLPKSGEADSEEDHVAT